MAPATRARVQQAATRLGYRPDRVARSLRTGRSRLLGLSVRMYLDDPDSYPADAYFALLIASATSAAMKRGYALALLPDSSDGILADLPVEALLVADPVDDDPAIEQAHAAGIPVVSDLRRHDDRTRLVVDVDHTALVGDTCDHLVARGARRVGLLGLADDSTFARVSREAYERWCSEHGRTPVVELAREADLAGLHEAADRLWAAGCDAGFGLASDSGEILVTTARSRGLGVPHDVMVVCCSEDLRYGLSDPPLTTVSLDPVTIARLAVELAIQAVDDGVPDEPVVRLVPPVLVPRISTRD